MIKFRLLFGATLLWILVFSILVTILLAVPLFYLEIGWEHLSSVTGLSSQTIQHNFNTLMVYLLDPFVTHLQMPDFPSSASGLEHFKEVKHLFMFVMALVIVLSPLAVQFIRKKYIQYFRRGLQFFMLAPVILGIVAIFIGFDQFFIFFHEILFANSNWLFDPLTDPIINVLPESYFMIIFIIFFVIFEILSYSFYRQTKND
ncbi:MAG: TIGR01906 family membrane protein [Streptococcaceae bacterium]|nr:TIGR01906 family membrane protein [Streptococcaceae bacterium]